MNRILIVILIIIVNITNILCEITKERSVKTIDIDDKKRNVTIMGSEKK